MLFARNQILLAKVEADAGVDAAPVAADAVRCAEINPEVDGINLERLDISTLSALQEKLINKKIRMSITVHLKGSGAAGTAPEWGPLARACGLKQTLTPATRAEYKPTNTASEMESVTLYLYKDGLLWKVVGAMGNMRVNYESGNYVNATFDMEGKYESVEDTAMVASPVYDDLDPIQVQEAGLTFGDWDDAVAPSFSFNTGATITDRLDINSEEGIHSKIITARDPRWEASIEAVLETENSFWADFLALDTAALAVAHGAETGNIIEFAAPKASFSAPRTSNNNSILMYDLGGQLLENTGADNFTITVK